MKKPQRDHPLGLACRFRQAGKTLFPTSLIKFGPDAIQGNAIFSEISPPTGGSQSAGNPLFIEELTQGLVERTGPS
jgi:hypothetical protein